MEWDPTILDFIVSSTHTSVVYNRNLKSIKINFSNFKPKRADQNYSIQVYQNFQRFELIKEISTSAQAITAKECEKSSICCKQNGTSLKNMVS